MGDLGRADIMQKLRAMSAGLVCLYTQITDAVRRTQGRGSQERQELSGSHSLNPSIHFFIQKIFINGVKDVASEEG